MLQTSVSLIPRATVWPHLCAPEADVTQFHTVFDWVVRCP